VTRQKHEQLLAEFILHCKGHKTVKELRREALVEPNQFSG